MSKKRNTQRRPHRWRISIGFTLLTSIIKIDAQTRAGETRQNYKALVAQAEIELAFHSPETVGSWHARWSDRVAEHDLETLFWQRGERFPSLAGMERWQWQDMPFWQVIAEASLAAREAGHAVREMERWMVPNKLREAA